MRLGPLLSSLAILAAAACSSSSPAPAVPMPVDVTTVEGPVHGDTSTENVRIFRGIPYAASPDGQNRFKPPQPVTPWTAPRDATQFGSQCPQTGLVAGVPSQWSEDCLYLNVWTPAARPAGAKPMPVMVWIHGGAFVVGSGADPMYEASRFVEHTGVMVVTLNYRLGVFGFLAHPDAGANFGLQDQRAALEWVKRNAAAFGGDPGNVTIFGESAGGMSVSLLSLWPDVAPLFQRAIVESGPATLLPWPTMEQAAKQTTDLGVAVGCTGADLIACLRGTDANKLMTALHLDPSEHRPGGLFQANLPTAAWLPSIDGNVMREAPADMLAKGGLAKVPYILGTTADEAVLFHSGFLGDSPITDEPTYEKALAITFGADGAAKVVARYPMASFKDGNTALAHVETLAFFRCPTRRQARAATTPVYLYELTRPATGGFLSGLGAIHGTDFIYLFGNDGSIYGSPGDDGQPLVTAMQDYWGALATSGDPNATASQPKWPAYGADDRHLVLDVPVSDGAGLDKDDCDFWDGLTTAGQATLPPTYAPPVAPVSGD